MQQSSMNLPRWCWHKQMECVVEVIKQGHFPTTVMVVLPNNSTVETDIEFLEVAPL